MLRPYSSVTLKCVFTVKLSAYISPIIFNANSFPHNKEFKIRLNLIPEKENPPHVTHPQCMTVTVSSADRQVCSGSGPSGCTVYQPVWPVWLAGCSEARVPPAGASSPVWAGSYRPSPPERYEPRSARTLLRALQEKCLCPPLCREAEQPATQNQHTVCNLQTLYLMVLPNRYSLITYLQDLDVCDASFMAENSCYSLKAHTQSCEHQREERLIVPAAGTKIRIVHKIFNIVINTTEEVCHIIYLLESLFFVYRVFSTTQRTSETLFSTDTIKETCCAFPPFC